MRPQPGNRKQATINHSKGEQSAQKKSMNLRIFRVSKSDPCNSLQLLVDPRRKNKTRGVFPLFPEREQGRSEIFQVLENSLS
jgi:hypothetical protein